MNAVFAQFSRDSAGVRGKVVCGRSTIRRAKSMIVPLTPYLPVNVGLRSESVLNDARAYHVTWYDSAGKIEHQIACDVPRPPVTEREIDGVTEPLMRPGGARRSCRPHTQIGPANLWQRVNPSMAVGRRARCCWRPCRRREPPRLALGSWPGAEVRQGLVDHRPLREKRHAADRAVARRATERIDLDVVSAQRSSALSV